MTCPHCSGKLKTPNTKPLGNTVRRYKKCTECGEIVQTIERIYIPKPK